MAKIVNSWNDWDPLKRVIVGLCDNSVIPPEEPATSEKVPVDSEMRGMWGLRPLRTVEVGNACLENLVKALEERGVVVDRPTPLQWNQAIGTPDFRNDSMMTCMPPRDILLTMGNEIMASANSFRCRYFEYLAYWPLMKQYFDEDPDFLWTQAPAPAPDRQVLQAQLLRREDLAGGAPGAHRQQGLRHDGSRADVGRRRRHAHGARTCSSSTA